MISQIRTGVKRASIIVLVLLNLVFLFGAQAQAQSTVFPTGIVSTGTYIDYLQPHSNAVAIAAADFNGDGKLDLVIAENGNGGGNIQFLVQLGNGDGTFQGPIFLGASTIDANWAAVGDFNGDGIPDIVGPSGSGAVTIWLGDGTGNFTIKENLAVASCCYNIRAGAVGDFNGDGKLDVVIINDSGSPGIAEVYLGNGDGTLQTTPAVVTLDATGQTSPISVVAGDFNHDGFLDFAAANFGNTDLVYVVLGKGDGTFQTPVSYSSANGQNISNVVSFVTADFNHDGYLDLAMLFKNGNAIGVFLNNGSIGPGTFTSPSIFYSANGSVTDPPFPTDLAVADFNKDGNPDLVFSARWRGGAGVLLGNADGTFGQNTWWVTDTNPGGVATGDFNGDGNPDFVVAATDNNSVTVLLGNGDGSFKSARNYVPFNVSGIGCQIANGIPTPGAAAFGDFNGDGKPDMAVADASNCLVAVFLNNGDGTFTESGTFRAGGYQPSGSIAAADVNGDKKLDIIVSTGGGSSSFSVLLGNGDGTFQSPIPYSNGTSSGSDDLVVADVNGDGKPDVISDSQNGSANASFYVSLGNGDGTFQPALPTPALCPGGGGSGAVYFAVADLNGDSKPDIVGACSAGLHLSTGSILFGNGDGTFGAPATFASGTTPVGFAIGDFNGDGKPDLAVVDNSPTPQVSVVLGNGDGTFQTPSSYSIFPFAGFSWNGNAYPSPVALAAADFNQDGHLDVLVGDIDAFQSIYNGVGSYSIGVQLFLANGDGTLQTAQNYLAGRQAISFAVADLNLDGKPDVAVVDPGDQSVNVLINTWKPQGVVLQSIAVSPNPVSVAAGLTQQLSATGHYSDGSTKDLTAAVTWSSANTSVVTMNTTGLATGVAQGGPVTITAALNGVSGTTPLTVTQPALQSITVSPATATVAAGLTQQFTATGHYSDGSSQIVTSTAVWSSSNRVIATIRSTGLARGVSAGGPVTITASLSPISGTAQLTVTAPLLVSISVSPANPSVLAGNTQQFTATGGYTDGSNQNLTSSVTWSSSNTAVATINTLGLASARSNGSATILARLGGVSGSTTMKVATLQSLTIAPLSLTIFAGYTFQFTATGHYSDGSVMDLTTSAQWTSSKPLTASISSVGLAQGLNNGATTIAAAYHSFSASTTLAVNAVLLQSITVSPASVTIPPFGKQQFTATGHYNDGSSKDLTNAASWSLAPKWLGVISSTGLATGSGPAAGLGFPGGTGTTNAKFQGVVGSATLTVLP